MRLAFLPALLLALAQGENQAEKLFRESENKLLGADQAQITVESTVEGLPEKGHLKGTVLLARGNKANVVMQGKLYDEKFQMSLVSNGTKMKVDIGTAKRAEQQDTPRNFNALFAGTFSRVGLLAGIRGKTRRAGEKEPGLDDQFQVFDFVLGKKEKVGEREAQVITYKLVIDNHDTAESTVWLDTETRLPLKRIFDSRIGKQALHITETYQVRVNGKIDAKKFELPK